MDDAAADGADVSSGVASTPGSARAAIGAAIEVAARVMHDELPRARAGDDPEGVHQARVATRRLRSDLRTFGPLLDDDWRSHVRGELQRLADALGDVRDQDVLAIRLRAAGVDATITPNALLPLLDALAEQRCESRRRLVEVIDDDRTAALLDELQRAADDPPTTFAALGRAERRMKPLVRRPWRKLAKAVAALGDDPPAADLHRVRLRAKRVRYAAEAVTPVYGRSARRFAKAVREIQDVLGDMNDAEVAMRWLADTAPDLDAVDAFTAGRLAQHFRAVADEHRHGWEGAYRRALKRSDWLG